MFGRRDPQKHGLEEIRHGVREYEQCLEDEQERLSELFSALKSDILSSLSSALTLDGLRVLKKQVRHVVSVARAVGFEELEQSFSREEEILSSLEEILEEYPSADLSSSGDVRSSLRKLRDMVDEQQRMIFRHKEILLHEKQRLVEILQEADSLEQDLEQDRHLSAEPHETIS